jgi:lipopolysaccharide/colanic/teichoic acid biosynthesis glycosyltransferase
MISRFSPSAEGTDIYMTPTLMHRVQLKRAFDLVFAFAGLVIVLPLLAVIAAAVWAGDRDPVFFAQERLGRYRRPFRMLKFRTMVLHAERTTGPTWSWTDDPRVTPVGRILRATHLDELPQLWNVLRGEMSFVGPRPERAVFVEQLERVIPGYINRLAIRPGITGLSQLRSGYDDSLRSVRRKIRYDLLYVRRGCTLLDAKIILDTFLLVAGLSGGWALRRVPVRVTPAHRPLATVTPIGFDHSASLNQRGR